jgi:hypothetical protein
MLGKREGEKTVYLFQWHQPLEIGKRADTWGDYLKIVKYC